MSEDKLYSSIDDLLRAKFDSEVETPSDFVWENIEQNLDNPKKKRRFLFWFLPSLLLLTIVIWLYTSDKKNNADLGNSNKENSIVESNGTSTNNDNNSPKKTKETKDEIATNSTDKNALHQVKDTSITVKNILTKQKKAIQKINDTPQKEAENIQSTTSIKNTKNSAKNSSTKKSFIDDKHQKNAVNNKAFAAAKSYTDISKVKIDFEQQSNSKSSEIVANIELKSNESISKPVVLNELVIADTIVKISIDTTNKAVDTTTTNKNEEVAKKKNKKLFDKYLNFYLTPNVSSHSFAASNTAYDFLNEKGKLSFSIGASYCFSISNKFSVSVGLGYNRLKFSLDNTPLTFGRFITQPYVFNTAIGNIAVDAATMKDGFSPASPTFPTQFKINYNYSYSLHYITFPVELQYKLIDKKIKFFITGGVTAHFLTKQKATLSLVKEKKTNIITYNNFDVNKTIIGSTLGFNIQFPSKNKWHFYIEPLAQFILGYNSKSTPVNTEISTFGLSIGGSLKL